MDLRVGSNLLLGVEIPLLWGKRAVLQDRHRRISVIDLGGPVARIEVLGGRPAPGVEFRPVIEGFQILSHGRSLFEFHPKSGRLISTGLNLPDCEITPTNIKVGSVILQNNAVSGFGVGIVVDEGGISIAGPVPEGLARLAV